MRVEGIYHCSFQLEDEVMYFDLEGGEEQRFL